jgi:hypothetical protein
VVVTKTSAEIRRISIRERIIELLQQGALGFRGD